MDKERLRTIDSLIDGLYHLTYNLWWTWNPRAQDIYNILSERKWRSSNHNAVAVLKSISRDELRARLVDKELAQLVHDTLEEFRCYREKKDTWWSANAGENQDAVVAYFSAEFGLHECLPIYSGGLGVLAGDHTKSASDLGVPFVGISLYYRNGYFQQTIGPEGWQYENYPLIDNTRIPATLVTHPDGTPVTASVCIGHQKVTFHAFRLNVGRAVIYLLDTNRPENDLHHREISARVYGGDASTRIMQEIVLGIGGVRFLRALDIHPSTYHLNEGHSAFLLLELLSERMADGETMEEAEAWVRAHSIFTTHTPVPAGHDRFTPDLMEYSLGHYANGSGLSLESIMKLGREYPDNHGDLFCMTVLALRLCHSANAVSELHGEVSRSMWKHIFTDVEKDEDVPISHLTNGVHMLGWMANRTRLFWHRHLGERWIYYLKNRALWQQVGDPELVPDEDLWMLRYNLRRDLVEYVRRVQKKQSYRMGIDPAQTEDNMLSADTLTIGFARRFATYKRAPLVFREFDRIVSLISDADRPVQFVFAGKAHPRDDEGKKYIQKIVGLTKNPALFGKIVYLENYDISVARHMVSGVDVWLNTPRRPMEASGTSGMKTLVHGGLNFSILDGWWREGYDGTNGWAIGSDDHPDNEEEQDVLDAESLYKTLEEQIIPDFYDRDEFGIPRKWIARMRRSMMTLIPQFNTDRMVAEYATRFYIRKEEK